MLKYLQVKDNCRNYAPKNRRKVYFKIYLKKQIK